MEIQSSMGSALSGMNAAAQNVQNPANNNNVANLRQEDNQVRRPEQTEEAARNAQQRVDEERATTDARTERDRDAMMAEQNAYTANPGQIRTAEQMMGAVLDLRA
jgi:flagellar hook-associated protein FlgK